MDTPMESQEQRAFRATPALIAINVTASDVYQYWEQQVYKEAVFNTCLCAVT